MQYVPPIRARRSVLIIFGLLLLLVMGGMAEFGARLLGYRPWQPEDLGISVVPGNRFFTSDPVLGWKHLPGQFTVRLKNGFRFTVTHTSDTLRITQPLAQYGRAIKRPAIWVFGCSFTHGWSVDDEQTYCYKLQSLLPQYEVVNFGCSGYGLLQSKLQLEQALKTKEQPAVVLLAYGSYQDERSAFTRNRAKNVAPWNRLGMLSVPCGRIDANGHLVIRHVGATYAPFPLMGHSAFMHLVEQAYNKWDERMARGHEVNKLVVNQINDLCRQRQITPALVQIVGSPEGREMLEYCRQLGMPAADVTFMGFQILPIYSNLPHDLHPSPLAHTLLAQNIHLFLRQNVLGHS